jgi:hypothetical protein
MMNINLLSNTNSYDDLNKDPVKYYVEDYCKKHPDDRGNQSIHAEDVVRPYNHKWVDIAEQSKWLSSYWGDSNDVKLYYERRAPTYGTCEECWASGPSY